MRAITMSLAAALLLGAAPPPPTLPGWMAGCWVEQKGDAWTEECWTAPRAGSMLGSGRSGRGAVLRNWEVTQMLAEPDGGFAYWGAPHAAGRTRFALASSSATDVVFINPAHDYPQRIRYWRDGATLKAETSLIDGSKTIRWTYRRQG